MLLTSLATRLSENPALALPALFVGGVFTSLTPCIYPMIPITAAIVGGAASPHASKVVTVRAGSDASPAAASTPSRARTVAVTIAYVLGLSLVYASLGLIAGMTGTMFGTISTNPWLHFAMANALLMFALMMLDVVPVPVPQSLLDRAASITGGRRISGAFAMGATSGLVAAPCGAPVMASVLTWVATTKSAALGFLYLFTFSLGMCTLLVIIGLATGAASRLPRSGVWMLWVKRGFAALMLGVAEYYFINMGQLLP